MKMLLCVAVLFAGCAPKAYTEPTVGMHYLDFTRMCSMSGESNTTTNSSGEARTLVIKPTDFKGDKNPSMCVGTFTFVDNKLDSISR